MTDHNHPLTETAAAELWDEHAGDTVPWDDWYGGSRRALTALLRAAFDAGSIHATNNLRDTPAGRELMAETWQEGAMDHAAATNRMTPETRRIINELMKAANPYLNGDSA